MKQLALWVNYFVDNVWTLLTTFFGARKRDGNRSLTLKVQALRTCQLIWCRYGTKPETEIILSLKV